MQVIAALVLLMTLLVYMRVFLPLASRLDQVPTCRPSPLSVQRRMCDVDLRCFEVLVPSHLSQQ